MPLTADIHGALSGKFTIPANTPHGKRAVHFTGLGGSFADATFIGDQSIDYRDVQREVVNGTYIYDPLAQTFTLPESRMISGIDIKFCAKGTLCAYVQIRGCQLGLPNNEIFGEAYLANADMVLGGGWTHIDFDIPVYVEGGQEYAIVLLTDDPLHSVAVATLGGVVQVGDGPNAPHYITKQPYTTGVLLSSSNAKTWTPLQNSDLTFQLYCAVFDPTTKVVPLGTRGVTNVTDFEFLGVVARNSAACDVQFHAIEQASGDDHQGQEGQQVSLQTRLTDTLTLNAALSGERNVSPILYRNPQVLTGNLLNTADYITTTFQAAVSFNARVIFECLKPGSASIVPYLAKGRDDDAVDGGGAYLYDWVAASLQARIPVGDGWFEETWELDTLRGIGLDRVTRLKLVLTGTPLNRPHARKLRAFTI